jgi:TonB family protein
VDTGARGEGAGLSLSPGVTPGEPDDLKDFCCKDYLTELTGAIASHWQKNTPERGTTTIKFTILRDGSIVNDAVETSSGFGSLDRLAQSALRLTKQLRPLPAQYPHDTLTIHMVFQFTGPQE